MNVYAGITHNKIITRDKDGKLRADAELVILYYSPNYTTTSGGHIEKLCSVHEARFMIEAENIGKLIQHFNELLEGIDGEQERLDASLPI
jgi:hypothetical protein